MAMVEVSIVPVGTESPSVSRYVALLPGSVHFVSNAPPPDVVWLGVSTFVAAGAPRRFPAPISVFDFLGCRSHRPEPGVDHDQRLGIDVAAECDKLVEAEVVVLDFFPGFVPSRRPTIARPNAVFPIVAGDEVSARPAVDGGIQFLE